MCSRNSATIISATELKTGWISAVAVAISFSIPAAIRFSIPAAISVIAREPTVRVPAAMASEDHPQDRGQLRDSGHQQDRDQLEGSDLAQAN